MDSPGRQRAQSIRRDRSIERAWSGAEPLAQIASVAAISEPAVCPSCAVVSRMVHLSMEASLAEIQRTLIPGHSAGKVLRQASCILCTIAVNPVVRTQEAFAGHIWFLIGEEHGDEQPPSQSDLNQHLWGVIEHPTPRHRAAARRQILELAATEAFGRLRLPHQVITGDEQRWLLDRIRQDMGADAPELLGEEGLQAVFGQFGVPSLVQDRRPTPAWKARVRFVPTPEGVERYRLKYAASAQALGA